MMHIMTKKKRKNVNINMPGMSIGCEFQVQKYRSDGTITYQGPWFKNTVLNVGLDMLVGNIRVVSDVDRSNNLARYINVGTGTSDPIVTHSGLDNHLASTSTLYGGLTTASNSGDIETSLPWWYSWQLTFAFAVGACGTNNLTELGLSKGSNSSYFNRQLFRDSIGDPTVIPIQSDEGLRVTCKIILYGAMAVGATTTGVFDINDIARNCTITQLDPRNDRIFPGSIPNKQFFECATESDSWSIASSLSSATYTAGNFYQDHTATWNAGNFVGDLKRIRVGARQYNSSTSGPGGNFNTQITLDDAIEISDTQELKLNFRRSWGRV